MTIALIIVIVTETFAFLVAADRKDKRHASQVDRLLLWRHDPKAAALPEQTGAALYLAPEDDEAWNEQHGKKAAS